MHARFAIPLSPDEIDRIAAECSAFAHAGLLDFAPGEEPLPFVTFFARDLIHDALGEGPPRTRELVAHVLSLTRAARAHSLDVDELVLRLSRFVSQVERGVLERTGGAAPPGPAGKTRHGRWLETDALLTRAAIFAFYGDAFGTPAALDSALRSLIVQRSRVGDIVRAASRDADVGTGAVIATDIAGTILYWNDAATTLYGWRGDEVIGRDIIEVTPASHTAAQAEEIMRRLAQGEAWSGSFAVRDRSGMAMLVEVMDMPVTNDGAVVGVVGISRPATAH